MKHIKIIHIHSDLKFIYDSRIFENSIFVNQIIIIGNKNNCNGPYKENALFFKQSRKDIFRIINLCKTADIVVLYDLNFIKSFIINRLPSNIKIIWRFFGYELYEQIPEQVYSELSMKAINKDEKVTPWNDLIAKIRRGVSKYICWRTSYNKEFNKALKRIDYLLGLSVYEYNNLKQIWPYLPQFIQYTYTFQVKTGIECFEKSNEIIVGNNRNAYNNHLDILELIKKSKKKINYNFLLFFNYGKNNNYAAAVRKKAEEIKEVRIIEDFLSIEIFEKVYEKAIALVINGYRQMAMGNIFTAFRKGVKVYLNRKNIIYDWLKSEGFLVSLIEDFVKDIETDNVSLTEKEAQNNIKQLNNLKNKYNIDDFHRAISEVIFKVM